MPGTTKEYIDIHPFGDRLFYAREYWTKIPIGSVFFKHVPVCRQPILFCHLIIIDEGNPAASGFPHSIVASVRNILSRLNEVVELGEMTAYGLGYYFCCFCGIVIDNDNLHGKNGPYPKAAVGCRVNVLALGAGGNVAMHTEISGAVVSFSGVFIPLYFRIF